MAARAQELNLNIPTDKLKVCIPRATFPWNSTPHRQNPSTGGACHETRCRTVPPPWTDVPQGVSHTPRLHCAPPELPCPRLQGRDAWAQGVPLIGRC